MSHNHCWLLVTVSSVRYLKTIVMRHQPQLFDGHCYETLARDICDLFLGVLFHKYIHIYIYICISIEDDEVFCLKFKTFPALDFFFHYEKVYWYFNLHIACWKNSACEDREKNVKSPINYASPQEYSDILIIAIESLRAEKKYLQLQ